MATPTHTYIAFDADTDMHYYRIMQAWKENASMKFDFENAHDLNKLREGSSEETIKRALRERMKSSNIFILLVGEKTKNLYKYVRWEIETANSLSLPIIVANLNGKRSRDSELCPPILEDKLAIHVSFKKEIIRHALANWPSSHVKYAAANENTPYYYKDSVYEELGLNITEAQKKLQDLARLRSLR